MRIEDGRWVINSRDIWHGTECFDHCLKLSMAVAAELPDALYRIETHKESGGVAFRKAQGNEYEALRNSQLSENLGSDFIEIPSNSEPGQVVEWARTNKVVIAQAPFNIDFGDFDYKGRADLLVRNDYRLAYKADGTLTAVKDESLAADGTYAIWEIKHSSKYDSKGKPQNVDIYKYQLALAYEGLSALGVASQKTCGIVFKEQETSEFDPVEALEATRLARKPMFEWLNEVGPHRKKAMAVEDWRCDKPSVCKDAKCDYPDICTLVRFENDELHQIYNIHYTHVPKLIESGHGSIAKLLAGDPYKSGVAEEQIDKHLRWARVINDQRNTGTASYGKFSSVFEEPNALPKRSDSDLFVDFEWYTPLNTREYFYYMFGILDRSGKMTQFVADDRSDECTKFMQFLERVEYSINQDPEMHFYVANKTAEKTAIEKLAVRHSVNEDLVKKVLAHIFDVQDAAKSSIVVSTGSFGLKEMEVFFTPGSKPRSTNTSDGDDSMWQYHEYLRLADSGQAVEAKSIIEDIAKYNEDDCRATMRFYDWLARI